MKTSHLIGTAIITLAASPLAFADSMASEKSFDVNDDGFIDKEEAGESVEDFKSFDKDKDGKLTLAQFAEAIAARKNDGADTPADTTITTDEQAKPKDESPTPETMESE